LIAITLWLSIAVPEEKVAFLALKGMISGHGFHPMEWFSSACS
jgi:hypothetical protein